MGEEARRRKRMHRKERRNEKRRNEAQGRVVNKEEGNVKMVPTSQAWRGEMRKGKKQRVEGTGERVLEKGTRG